MHVTHHNSLIEYTNLILKAWGSTTKQKHQKPLFFLNCTRVVSNKNMKLCIYNNVTVLYSIQSEQWHLRPHSLVGCVWRSNHTYGEFTQRACLIYWFSTGERHQKHLGVMTCSILNHFSILYIQKPSSVCCQCLWYPHLALWTSLVLGSKAGV